MEKQEVIYAGDTVKLQTLPKMHRFRDWFRQASDRMSSWREEAREDYGFYTGEAQWSDEDLTRLKGEKRPAITINRIKPLINTLCGYQRINRTDIEFLPRTNDDAQLCEVRKGVTKYVMDSCDYDTNENLTFLDGVVTGLGWFEVGYRFKYPTLDGDAFINRISPFDIYVDSESHKADFSDGKYIIRAKWVEKEDLIQIYPEYREQILAQERLYDENEPDDERRDTDWNLYYDKEKRKLRLVECWYKEQTTDEFFILANGDAVRQGNMTEEIINSGTVIDHMKMPVTIVRIAVFFGEVLLEDKESPYQHGEFPFVPFSVYYTAEGDEPQGVVRQLKDVQREINKRRSQGLHILNTQANTGWLFEDSAISPEQQANFKKLGSSPGTILKVRDGVLQANRLRQITPQAPATNVQAATVEAENDITAISGINEALMGTDIAANASGRAIELKQKQAVTQIVPILDSLRTTKKKIAYLLWGARGHKGIIPQYYTDEKTFRIIGPTGKQTFVTANQQVQTETLMGTITTVLNDLSQGEFDVVVADSPQTSTQRTAQFWALTDAIQQLGIDGTMVFDIIIQLSDIPNKEEILQRWQQKQNQIAEQAKAQQEQTQMLLQQRMELEKIRKLSQQINYKDMEDPARAAILAKADLLPKPIADIIVENWALKNVAPMLPQNQQMAGMYQQLLQGSLEQQQASPQNQQALAEMLNKLPPEQRQLAMNRIDNQNNTQMADQEINDTLRTNGQMPEGINRVVNEQTKQLAPSVINAMAQRG